MPTEFGLLQLRQDSTVGLDSNDPILARGEPCLGFSGNTLILKVGNGVQRWSQLPAIGAGGSVDASAVAQISAALTQLQREVSQLPTTAVTNPLQQAVAQLQQQVAALPSSTQFRGSVANTAALPTTGNTDGDVMVTIDDGHLHVWSSNSWSDIGPSTAPDLTAITTAMTTLGDRVTVNEQNIGALVLRADENDERLNDLTDTTPFPWDPTTDFDLHAVVRHNGGTWYAANRDPDPGEEPGVDAKWQSLTLEHLWGMAKRALDQSAPAQGVALPDPTGGTANAVLAIQDPSTGTLHWTPLPAPQVTSADITGLRTLIDAIHGIPAGGAAGTTLVKSDGTDYHVEWAPITFPDADGTTKGMLVLAGDLGGTADAPTVPGLTGIRSSISTLQTQVSALSHGVTIRGTVANAAVLPSTGNTDGDVYITEDTGTLHVWHTDHWTALHQALPEASASTKGILQLAGDLGGTSANPTVPGLAAKADASTLTTLQQAVAALVGLPSGGTTGQVVTKTASGVAWADPHWQTDVVTQSGDFTVPVDGWFTHYHMSADGSSLTLDTRNDPPPKGSQILVSADPGGTTGVYLASAAFGGNIKGLSDAIPPGHTVLVTVGGETDLEFFVLDLVQPKPFWHGTKADYDAIHTKDPERLYVIVP